MIPAEIPILVVDDVQTVRVQVKEILREAGFENVQTANNVVEALQLLAKEKFSLVIADLHMEPLNGLDLLKAVRNNDDWKNLSFVVLTADGTKPNVLASIQCGTDDYIVKPLRVEHCQLKIMSALMKRNHL